MQFMLSLIGEEPNFDEITPEAMQAVMDEMDAYNRELEAAGAFVMGGGLQELANSKTVRFAEGGESVVSDGPFAETKEQLAGFWIIECKDLDEAIEWTRKAPLQEGAIEVRPFAHDIEGRPGEVEITAEELLEGVKGNAPATS